MKSLLALVSLVVPSLALGQTSSWSIDPAHSRSAFSVRHLAISTVQGEFGKTTGTIAIDEKDLRRSTVEAVIDVSTLDTRQADRDKHLKSADFFDVEKHPSMTFKSTKVEKLSRDKLRVTGDLTLHGVTKAVLLDVTYTQPIKGMMGETRRGFSASTRLNRRDFGLTWSKLVEATPVVSDEVNVSLEIEAVKEEPLTAGK